MLRVDTCNEVVKCNAPVEYFPLSVASRCGSPGVEDKLPRRVVVAFHLIVIYLFTETDFRTLEEWDIDLRPVVCK